MILLLLAPPAQRLCGWYSLLACVVGWNAMVGQAGATAWW
jgi:hypothetical protein